MAKGSDDITMTLKLEGKDIGPVRLNMQVSKKIAVAGGESGIMSAIASTTGLDVINRAAAGRTFVFVHNTSCVVEPTLSVAIILNVILSAVVFLKAQVSFVNIGTELL